MSAAGESVHNAKQFDVLLVGQRSTGRLETLEKFLLEQASVLVVIGVAGLHHPVSGYVRVYRDSRLVRTMSLPSFRSQSSSAIMFPFYFATNAIIIVWTVLRLGLRYQLGVGISPFYAFMLNLLKPSRLLRNVVYYCLDYYVATGKAVNDVFVAFSHWLDCFLAANSVMVWDLAPRIESERRKHCGKSATQMLVPLTYDASLARNPEASRWDRWTVAFVGTLDREKGLDLLADALEIAMSRIPALRIGIIGSGPDRNEFEKKLTRTADPERIVFYGFIQDESKVIDILSSCALGLAPYPTGASSYAVNADPGKLKLYAFCGIPMVSTRIPSAALVEDFGVGLVSDESPASFADAIVALLSDERLLKQCRRNTALFAREFTSQRVLGNALRSTLARIKMSGDQVNSD